MLYIDDRVRGKHGIGRFARETVSRLDVPYRSLDASGNPARPWDLMNAARYRLSAADYIFSPGFNVGLTRARQIITLHDLIHLQSAEEQSRAKSFYYERIVKPAIGKAGLVVTVSPTSARAIEEWIGNEEIAIVNVGNGCAEIFFQVEKAEPGVGAPLLYVGSLKPHKRVDILFAMLVHNRSATATIVTNEAGVVRALALQHNIAEERITVVADCSDEKLLNLYRSHRCLVFPSELEGFGLPVVEAIGAGCAVVYRTSCESVRDIAAGVGTPVADDDPEAWWAAVYRSVPAIAPREWRERYSWQAVAGRLSRVLQQFA